MQEQLTVQKQRLNKMFLNYNESAHSEFIVLPQELKGRSLIHVKCDCQDLITEGHYCGSHALTHAIDIGRIYGGSARKSKTPSDEIKDIFIEIGIGDTKADRINATNIKRAADYLSLDNIFLELQDNMLISIFHNYQELPYIAAFKKLDKMRYDILSAGMKPMVKYIFAVLEVLDELKNKVNHVVLFSVIWDGQDTYITLHDNLNQPIEINSHLFKFSNILIKYFIEVNKERLAYEMLVNIFANTQSRLRYLEKIMGYSRLEQRNDFLDFLFTQWLDNTKASCIIDNIVTIKPLNTPIKSLKFLHFIQSKSIAKNLIIRIYQAMLFVIHNTKNIALLDSVIKAIKKSSFDQKIFSLQHDEDAIKLFESAQNLRTSLNLY